MMPNSSLPTAGSLILASALLAGCDSVEETLTTSLFMDENCTASQMPIANKKRCHEQMAGEHPEVSGKWS